MEKYQGHYGNLILSSLNKIRALKGFVSSGKENKEKKRFVPR